jgi:hypothetical protein
VAEILDGEDVGCDGAQEHAGLVAVVVAQREILEVMVGPHPEVVGHPLANTLRVVIGDVRGRGIQDGNADYGDRRQSSKMFPVFVGHQQVQHTREPGGRLVIADYVIEDDLERPGGGQGHGALDQHRREDNG